MQQQRQPIAVLSDTGNKAENWLKWKRNFINYLKENDYITKSEDLKIHLLRENIGVVGQEVIDTIYKNSNEPINNMNMLLKKLDACFEVPKNEIIERYNFFTRFLHKDESIDAYILDLKKKAETCNFGSLTDSLIRDKVIAVTTNKNLRKKLFDTENLDLVKLMTIYHEYNTMQTNATGPKNLNNEKVVQQKRQSKKHQEKKDTNINDKLNIDFKNNVDLSDKDHEMTKPVFKRTCWRCATNHSQRNCPAWGFKCMTCGERNHYTQSCPLHKNENKRYNINMETNTLNPFANSQTMNMVATSEMTYNMKTHVAPSCSTAPKNFSSKPSAPELAEVENQIYPNLNDIKGKTCVKDNLYLQNKNIKSNASFQKSETSMPSNSQTRNFTQPPNPPPRNNSQFRNHQPKNEESCKIS